MPTLECNYVENRIIAACTKSMGTRNRHMIIIIMICKEKGESSKNRGENKRKKGRGTERNKE